MDHNQLKPNKTYAYNCGCKNVKVVFTGTDKRFKKPVFRFKSVEPISVARYLCALSVEQYINELPNE